MSDELPASIAHEVARLPELRMGVHRLRVALADRRAFDEVMVASNRVVRVLGLDDIPFEGRDVVAVTDLSDAPLPLGY